MGSTHPRLKEPLQAFSGVVANIIKMPLKFSADLIIFQTILIQFRLFEHFVM